MDVLAYALAKKYAKEGLAKKADLVDGKIPADELPSYVDDIVEYASRSEFPATGETGKIYVADDTGFTYRWSGSEYVQVNARDSVLEFASLSAFPLTGAPETIYVALDTNRLYRWDETTSAYIQVSESLDIYDIQLSDIVEVVSDNTFHITEDLYNKVVSNKYIFRLDASLFNEHLSGPMTYYPMSNVHSDSSVVTYASSFVLFGISVNYFFAYQRNDKYEVYFKSVPYETTSINNDGQLCIDDTDMTKTYYLPKINGVQLRFDDYYNNSLDINDIEVVQYQTSTPLTNEQVIKAQAGKLAIVVNHNVYLTSYIVGDNVYFTRVELQDSATSGPVSQITKVSDTSYRLSLTTKYLAYSGPGVHSVIRADNNNFFDTITVPTTTGNNSILLVRGQNLRKTQDMMASVYDPTATYDVGDYVIYQNDFYKCTTAITVAEAWNSTHWTKTSLSESLHTATELEVNRLFRTEYAITANITNGSASGDTSIWTKETAEVTIVPSSGYVLPETIAVSGATYNYDSSTGVVALSAVTDTVIISATCVSEPPTKGDIITLDGGTARYRVLKTNGNVAEVLALDDVANSAFNNSLVTTTFSDGSTGLKYENSNLDIYIASAFYSSLSTNIKNAIVKKAITQSIYQIDESTIAGYDFAMTRITSGTRWYKRKGQVSVGNKHCYALDLDDVAEYLGAGSGNTVSCADLNDMLFEQTTAISKYVWLDSANSDRSNSAFSVYGNDGCVYDNSYNNFFVVRPAFQVDLSKVTWAKESNVPEKGDIITLDGGTARYRVLKTNGNVAEVLALSDIANSVFNSSSVKTTFSDGSTGQKYEGSTLDNYMNSTFYNSLSTNIKNAIVQKVITQSIYQSSFSEISGYDFAMTRITSGTRWYKRKGEVSIGNRYCYALDVDDVVEYLSAGSGNTVSGADLNDMFFERTTVNGKYILLDSAYSGNSDYAFCITSSDGYVDTNYYSNPHDGRPAFQVDLSQVSWVKE